MPGARPSPAHVRSYLAGEHGFTLIELLVAIIVIAVLAAILVPDLFAGKGSSQDTRAKAALDVAKQAAWEYYAAHDDSFEGFTSTVLGELVPTLHESKPPGSTETAEGGGHDPLAVQVSTGFWPESEGENGPHAGLCSIPDKGTAVFCIIITPNGYKPWSYLPGSTYYSEGTSPKQTLGEVSGAKGTSSYGKEVGGWNRNGW